MKKIQVILMAVLLAATAGYSAVLVNATFETDTIGVGPGVPATGTAAIFKPVQTAATADNFVKVVGSGPGTGQAVQFYDNSGKPGDAVTNSSLLEYNFVTASNAQKSAVSFSFALSQNQFSSASNNGSMFMSIGQYTTDTSTVLSSSTKRAASFQLDAAGGLFGLNNGAASYLTTLSSGAAHTLAMYVNDYNSDWVSYNVSGTDYILTGNTVDYWVDGSRLLAGASLQLVMAVIDNNAVAGTIATAQNDLGRIGFSVGTAPYGIDVTLDNVQVTDTFTVIPEPATMGMLLLGAVTVLAVRRRRA